MSDRGVQLMARGLGEPTAAAESPEYFYALSAGTGTSASGSGGEGATSRVTLGAVAPVTVAVTERPRRQTTRLSTPEFIDGWDTTFGDDPPNASLGVVAGDGRQHEAAIEIREVARDAASGEVRMEVRVLSGSVPAQFDDATLVIDDAGASVRLELANETSATTLDVVVGQRNRADPSAGVVAWKVLDAAQGKGVPFTLPQGMEVSVSDSFGNTSPLLQAAPGDSFAVTRTSSGPALTRTGSTGTGPVTVANSLPDGAVDVDVARGGDLLATTTAVEPGGSADFEFADEIMVGATSGLQQGQIMNSAVTDQLTVLDLSDVSTAGIRATGGGTGAYVGPVTFRLVDVER